MRKSVWIGVLTVTLCVVGSVQAADVVWDGDTDTDWTNGANWVGGVAPVNDRWTDTAVFNDPAAVTYQPSLAGTRQIYGINFTQGGWTIGGVGKLE